VLFNATASALLNVIRECVVNSLVVMCVEVSQHFKDARHHFHVSTGPRLAHEQQHNGDDRACLHRKLHDTDVCGATCGAYLAHVVDPALLYGCEAWGQNCLQCLTDYADNNSLEVEQAHRH
jgi:hypothetical protein